MVDVCQAGFRITHKQLPKATTESQLLEVIRDFNARSEVHGIIVQLPLDSDQPIDEVTITNAVNPDKDVDGYVRSMF